MEKIKRKIIEAIKEETNPVIVLQLSKALKEIVVAEGITKQYTYKIKPA